MYLIAFMIVGAILGSALGTLIAGFFPNMSVITKNLTGPIGFSLVVISFNLRLNLSGIIGLMLGAMIYRRI
jgi:hypothetical protein